jgi:hypothetical protein
MLSVIYKHKANISATDDVHSISLKREVFRRLRTYCALLEDEILVQYRKSPGSTDEDFQKSQFL